MPKNQSKKYFVILFIVTFFLLAIIFLASNRLYKLYQLNNTLSAQSFSIEEKEIKHNDVPAKKTRDINLEDYRLKTNLENSEKFNNPETPVKVGYFTDAQCYKKNSATTGAFSYIKRCKEPLDKFLSEMKTYQPDIIIEGGDLIDGYDDIEVQDYKELDNLVTTRLNKEFIHVLGNHETNSFPKEKWLEITGYQHSYYFFDVGQHRFIIMDSNNRKVGDGNSFDTTASKRDYPGYVDEEQFRWLRKLLKNSKDYQVTAFIHSPVLKETDTKKESLLLLNGERIRKIFAKHNVQAVISGHVEDLCQETIDDVDYYVLKGFYKENKKLGEKFKDGGFFYELTFEPNNQMDIKTFYRPDKEASFKNLSLEGSDFKCNDRTNFVDARKKDKEN